VQGFFAVPGKFQIEHAQRIEQVLQVQMLKWVIFDNQ
jgi:hypothetical protein